MPFGLTATQQQQQRWQALSDADLDCLVVSALADSLRTEVPTEKVRSLGEDCGPELTSLLVFAPRVWHFGHRHSLSLRHPRVSFATWAHRIRGGAPMRQLYNGLEVMQASETLLEDMSPLGTGPKWQRVATVFQQLLQASPETEEARRRISQHSAVRSAIRRFWHHITGGFTDDDVQNGDVKSSPVPKFPPADDSASRRPTPGGGVSWMTETPTPNATPGGGGTLSLPGAASSGDWWATPGSMTPKQWMYLELRIVQTLLPDAPLASLDLLDVMEMDMILDIYRPSMFSTGGTSTDGSAVPGPNYDQEALSALWRKIADGEICTDPSKSAEARTGVAVDNVFGAKYQEHVWVTAAHSNGNAAADGAASKKIAGGARVRDFRSLPPLSFEQFARSMLELADNWTSTCCPAEHAAFLFDLYERIFTHDWSAQADALLVQAAVKRKAMSASTPGAGAPVHNSKSATTSAASARQRREFRRQSEAHVLESDVAQLGDETDLSMGQVLMLPPDVREGLLNGTAPEVIAVDPQALELEDEFNRRPPVVEVRFTPQYISHGDLEIDGEPRAAKLYTRGNRAFVTVPRTLFTLTTQETEEGAVAELTTSRTVSQLKDVSTRRRPLVRMDAPSTASSTKQR